MRQRHDQLIPFNPAVNYVPHYIERFPATRACVRRQSSRSVYLNHRRRTRAHLEVGYRPQAFWSRALSIHFLPRSIRLGIDAFRSAPRCKLIQLTIPAAATPRSRPSNNEHALHNSLLDMYPHRLHVSVEPSMSSGSENGEESLGGAHAALSVLLSLPL